ncbi:MAG: glycosyltransferase family 39 protein, partial [Chloroflexota bacterium]|nr:glycosyltransferase family 39 protein [Chloroflexota bacterium]
MPTRPRIRLWSVVAGWSVPRRFLLVLGFIYLAKQIVYLLVFPPFTGHDEVAHYSYVRTVAEEGRIPVLLQDYLPEELAGYCDRALGWCGRPIDRGPQYAANHPPLLYILLTPVYWLSDTWSPEQQLYLFRAMAIPFGLATVVLAYLLARTIFPADGFLPITVASFVAFQPQVSYEAAIVNNDIVGVAFYSWLLLLLSVGLRDRFPTRNCLSIGFALGLGLLSKGTTLTALPLIGLALTFGLPKPWRVPQEWLRRLLQIGVPALVLT